MKLYTIGFTRTTARDFFARLRAAGVRALIDTRLHRDGQLSGFAKAVDLEYFVNSIIQTEYRAEPLLAPTDDILKSYQKKALTWDQYSEQYRELLLQRDVARKINVSAFENVCLLCSEHAPDRCHRRLAAEFLRDAFHPRVAVEIIHL